MLFICCAAILVAVILSFTLYTYFTCFHAGKDRCDNPYAPVIGSQYKAVEDEIYACSRIMEKVSCEWVEIPSYDGLTLRGRYYHFTDGAPIMLLMHGYRGMALRDCSGGFILSSKLGLNILVPDQRAHGKSDGRVISFGIKERYDVLSWINYVNIRFGRQTPIVLSGLSMGASTVLMAAELDLPENVAGIIADSGFSAPGDIICKVCRDRGLPDWLCFPFIRLGARLFGGFSLTECSAEKAIQRTSLPILLLHGDDDRYVPKKMSEKIYAARNNNTELAIFPGAGHGLCYMVDPLRYEALNVRFLCRLPTVRLWLENSSFAHKYLSK